MKVENTQDLGLYMQQLKAWALQHSNELILSSIESAEKTSFTASELIIKYAETLKFLKSKLPDELPATLSDQVDAAIRVGLEAVETIEYPKKKRRLFSLG
ncbi:MAG: hypothetical protein EA369_03145 [Bradymonadales bacterium]|nr:MAG: hypothetical protein EA369_03145 [Bradymonadales bacterium]